MPLFKSKPCPELTELFSNFAREKNVDLSSYSDFDNVKKWTVLHYFIGAFPELINLTEKDKYIRSYTNDIDFNKIIDRKVEEKKKLFSRYSESKGESKGGSKKKKSKKSRKI